MSLWRTWKSIDLLNYLALTKCLRGWHFQTVWHLFKIGLSFAVPNYVYLTLVSLLVTYRRTCYERQLLWVYIVSFATLFFENVGVAKNGYANANTYQIISLHKLNAILWFWRPLVPGSWKSTCSHTSIDLYFLLRLVPFSLWTVHVLWKSGWYSGQLVTAIWFTVLLCRQGHVCAIIRVCCRLLVSCGTSHSLQHRSQVSLFYEGTDQTGKSCQLSIYAAYIILLKD